jgi:hypothetical protein
MRRLLALSLLITSLVCACAAGLAAPAAWAAGSSGTPVTSSPGIGAPSFGLSSGGAATTPQQTTPAVTPATTTSATGGSIWYDARGHAARVGHGKDEALFGQRAHAGSKAPPKPRKHKPAERKRRKRGRAR